VLKAATIMLQILNATSMIPNLMLLEETVQLEAGLKSQQLPSLQLRHSFETSPGSAPSKKQAHSFCEAFYGQPGKKDFRTVWEPDGPTLRTLNAKRKPEHAPYEEDPAYCSRRPGRRRAGRFHGL
jgi:hypothetical protein